MTKTFHLFLVAAPLIFVNGASNASPSEEDRAVLLDACKQMKSAERRALCLGAVARLGGDGITAQPQQKLAPAGRTNETILFKDIPLDKPGIKDALRKLCQENENNRRDDTCSFKERTTMIWLSYGILSHKLGWITVTSEDALSRVEISGSKGQMLALAEILEAKYGKPERTKSQVENKMGTKFDQDVFVWIDAQRSRITVESIHYKVDEGRVIIQSPSSVAAQDAAGKLIREAGKNNL